MAILGIMSLMFGFLSICADIYSAYAENNYKYEQLKRAIYIEYFSIVAMLTCGVLYVTIGIK